MELNNLPYAQWLEQALHHIIGKPVQSICIITRYDSDAVGTDYYNASVADKLLFAGYLQQDAMIDVLQVNGYIDDELDDLGEAEV